MAATNYLVTTAGDLHILHNGVVARAGRMIQVDSASPVTAHLLQLGWLTATVPAGTKYHDDALNLSVYHVTPAGAGHILHSTGNPPSTTPLTNGAAISLDPLDPGAQSLIQRGLIA